MPMTGSLKFSQTKSKWNQIEDNQQTMAKQNLIRPAGSQDTSACQISGHSSYAFLRNRLKKFPGNLKVGPFH